MQTGAATKPGAQTMTIPTSCTDFKEIFCILESMSVTSGDILSRQYKFQITTSLFVASHAT